MQQRMQGRFDDRNAARSMGAPTQSQMQGGMGKMMGAPDTQSPSGFAKGGRVKANGIARKGKTRGRII